MSQELFQKFLDRGLLDLGDGTDKFSYIKDAAKDLAAALQEDRRLLLHSGPPLFGSEFSDESPIAKLCERAIKEKWPTYRSRFPSSVTQLFRATLLQAIGEIVENPKNAALVYYGTGEAANLLLVKKEEEIFREFFVDLAIKVESEASKLWATMPTLAPAQAKPEAPIPIPVADAKWLTEALKNAIAPTGVAGANQHWPSSNSLDWAAHYGKGTADTLNNAITAILKDLVPKILARSDASDKLAVAQSREILESAAAGNFRTELIFWKEALYSPNRKISYRDLTADSVLYWAAFDLHERIPSLHPTSAEYFLLEAIRSVVGEAALAKKQTLTKFIGEFTNEPIALTTEYTLGNKEQTTLLEAIQLVSEKKISPTEAALLTGIPSDTTVSRQTLAVWLFRNFQASRLVGEQ